MEEGTAAIRSYKMQGKSSRRGDREKPVGTLRLEKRVRVTGKMFQSGHILNAVWKAKPAGDQKE